MSLANEVRDLIRERRRLFWLPPIMALAIVGVMVWVFGPSADHVCCLDKRPTLSRDHREKLITAAHRRDVKEVRRLLHEESDSIGGFAVFTPLIGAASWGYCDAVQLLLEKDDNVNTQGAEGDSALMCAVAHGHFDIVQLLVENGANVNAMSGHCQTPLGLAKRDKRSEIIAYLIAHGARTDINTSDGYGRTPLMLAARQNRLDEIRMLLDKGADANAKGCGGETALMWAVRWGQVEAAKLLLEKGADINAKNNYGWTAQKQAQRNTNVIELLKAYGATE